MQGASHEAASLPSFFHSCVSITLFGGWFKSTIWVHSADQSERAWSGSARPGRHRRQEPRQSSSQRRSVTAEEPSPALVSPLTSFLFRSRKTTSDRPNPTGKMMLKLACLLGVLVCGSQGRRACAFAREAPALATLWTSCVRFWRDDAQQSERAKRERGLDCSAGPCFVVEARLWGDQNAFLLKGGLIMWSPWRDGPDTKTAVLRSGSALLLV